MVFTRSHSVVKIPSHLFGLGKQMLRSSKSYNISNLLFPKFELNTLIFLAFLDLIKLSISCFSWCHLKQCNSQERKYSWTFKYCVTKSLRRSSCVHLIAVALFHRMAWQRLWEVPMIHNLSLAPSWLLHFFVFCFYIHFALFCHILGDGIATT